MVASEAAPFAKTGGLADVVGSLPAALKALGHEVAVLLPRYAAVDLKTARRVYDSLPICRPIATIRRSTWWSARLPFISWTARRFTTGPGSMAKRE